MLLKDMEKAKGLDSFGPDGVDIDRMKFMDIVRTREAMRRGLKLVKLDRDC